MRETVAVLRQMLAGERVTFEGRTIRTRGFRLVSLPPAPVPIYLAALMPPMLELAGEIADGVILNFMPVEAVPRMLEHVRVGAARAGRDASAARDRRPLPDRGHRRRGRRARRRSAR